MDKKIYNTVDRIKDFIDYKGISIRKFSENVGVSHSLLGKTKALGSDKLENILSIYPEINTEWLLLGEGSMLKADKDSKNDSSEDVPFIKGKQYEISEARAIKGVPLIPIHAMAGFGTGAFNVMDYDLQNYIVPEFTELCVDFMIRVKGSSMYPKYSSGDIVACKKLPIQDVFFQWNKVYLLDTEQGALIKRVKKGSDNEHITLVSDNEHYDPFELHLSKINAIALVMGVIRFE